MSATYQLNTQDSSVNIHINSEDAANFVGIGKDSGLIQTSDFVVVLDDIVNCDEEESMLLSIQNVEIPITYYNVSKALNNHQFVFQEANQNPITLTLPSKHYSIDDIITDLPPLLNNESQVGSNYTVSYDERTYKITITSSQFFQLFTLDFSNHSQTGKLLGYLPTSHTSSSGKITSQTPINMNSVPFLYLDTNFSTKGSILTNSTTNLRTFSTGVLCKIPINADAGQIVNYQPVNKHGLIIERKRIRSLRFTLRDHHYNVIDLNGIPFSLTLTVDFIDFTSAGVYNTHDPRDEKLTTTREDVSLALQNSLKQQGEILAEQTDERNKLINLLDLNQKL